MWDVLEKMIVALKDQKNEMEEVKVAGLNKELQNDRDMRYILISSKIEEYSKNVDECKKEWLKDEKNGLSAK